MADRKSGLPQKDFSLGAIRPEGRERDDTDLVQTSVREAENAIILSTGALEGRPGFRFIQVLTGATDFFEINPDDGLAYDLVPVPNGIEVYDELGNEIVSFATAPWTTTEGIWCLPLRDNILLGAKDSPIQLLQYDDGLWSFGAYGFDSLAGGASAQPYWKFPSDAKIRPSALTGSITVTADEDIFTAGHVGLRFRYVNREFQITGFTDARNVSATVIQKLPPTQNVTVGDASGFLVDEAVEADPSGAEGIITAVAGNVVTVLITKFFEGVKTSDDLVAPNHKSSVSSVSTTTPAATTFWDEPMISAVRGYPGTAAFHTGRVIFADFPEIPDGFAASVIGTINNFEAGVNDDDAIIESIGASRGARIKHLASAEDLIILTTKGPYYVQTRDGTPMTPTNFNPTPFDSFGCNDVQPVVVNDGVVFIGAGGESVLACTLIGDVYKAWRVQVLSEFHQHLLKSPVRLGSTADDTDKPERFVFAVNVDGTAAVMRWDRRPGSETVGWTPWTTRGTFKSMTSIFGAIHALVERSINGVPTLFLERAETGTYLDCSTGFTAAESVFITDDYGAKLITDASERIIASGGDAIHLVGETVNVWIDRFNLGEHVIDSLGFPTGLDLTGVDRQIGFRFETNVVPWQRWSPDSYAGDVNTRGLYEIGVAVQDTVEYEIDGWVRSAYDKSDDTSLPPRLKTEVVYQMVNGYEYDRRVTIKRTQPGPFRLLAVYHKVTV